MITRAGDSRARLLVLMMPLAVVAHAGSMLALTGSPVNVLFSEAAKDAGSVELGFFEFTIAVATSAALLTPVATPGNLMVMGPGCYRFGDYGKLGLPLMVWYFIISVGLLPLVWQF